MYENMRRYSETDLQRLAFGDGSTKTSVLKHPHINLLQTATFKTWVADINNWFASASLRPSSSDEVT